MNHNLYALFASNFPAQRDACAIETEHGDYFSWNDLEHASGRIANLLRNLGLQPGARIAVQVEKSAEAILLYLAVLRAGFVYLPLNTAYRAAELAYFIEDASPEVVVCDPANFGWIASLAFQRNTRHVFTLSDRRSGTLLDRAAHYPNTCDIVERNEDDLAAILYTSGTTGRSKGAMLSHGNLASNALVLKTWWHWQENDVLLHALPLFHVHGLFVACHGALINGSKMLLLSRFDADSVLDRLPRATLFMGVPTYYVRLLASDRLNRTLCQSMRLFISGSAPLLTETFTAFEQRTGHTLLERYGMTETNMLVSNPYEGERRRGTVGLPLPGISVRVTGADGKALEQGEIGGIEVRGPNVFKGYWNLPDKTREEFTEDGYFKTGDMGRFDRDGYLSIVGRSKDLIITGGYNVYPKEIEALIDDMPGVEESAVIGVPHPDFGEAVTAVVVAKAGATLSATDIIDALKRSIANFKVPKHVHVTDTLPRNTMGKVQKNLLREQYSSKPV